MEDLTSTLSALAISTKTPIQRCVEALIAEIAKTSPTQETARTLIREITTTLETAFCKESPATAVAVTNSAAATAVVATNSVAATAVVTNSAAATNSAVVTNSTATAVVTNSTAATTVVVTNSAAATAVVATNSAAATAAATNSAAAVATTLSIVEPSAKPSRGGSSLENGVAYEHKIRTLLTCYTYNELELHVSESTASGGHGQDIQFRVADITVNLECKDQGAFEGGGKTYKNVENVLVIPEECLHKRLLGDYRPFEGRIPSFLKGDKTLVTWEAEKHLFKDEYKEAPDTTVATYYRSKGIHYIQFEKKGLYTTGHDILELGVPLFKCETRFRIRCKRHRSSTMPSSVQASLTYTKKSIAPSPFDLQKKLPSKFKKVKEAAI